MLKNWLFATVTATALLAACSNETKTETTPSEPVAEETSPATSDNPLLAEWDTPFGIPPFGEIENDDYMPALEQGIEELRAEIDAIVSSEEPATFENTILALETSGETLGRVSSVFGNVTATDTNDVLRGMEAEFYKRITAERDAIYLNDALFERVKSVYEDLPELELDRQAERLVELTYRDFQRRGAELSAEDKERVKEINARLSEIGTKFSQNLVAETNGFELLITDEANLSGLSESLINSGRAAAEAKGKEGWLYNLNRSTYEAFMTQADSRDLRKKLFDGYRFRAANGGPNDSGELILETVRLRAEKAQLMGYENHAAFQLETRMAKTPQQAIDFLLLVWEPGLARAKEELADMQALVDASEDQYKVEGHDWWYLAEKVRQDKYAFDDSQLKPYFELSAMRDSVFEVSKKLFNIEFEPLDDVPLWNDTVVPFKVSNPDGSLIGVFMADNYARDSKRGGAWMSGYRGASEIDGEVVRPIVTNNLNLIQPAEGDPTLLSFDEVETLYHEFGHALHGLLTTIRYERMSGVGGPRDYTEFPAQIMEHWAGEPEVLTAYAKHYETGEPIPMELVEKMQAAANFNEGFRTTEYIAASLLDLRWHMLTPEEAAAITDPREFERQVLEEYGLIPEIEPRYRSPYFSHVFSGGYSAGYYAYLWSEILDSDGFAAFKKSGDIFNPDLAKKLKQNVYEAGEIEEADELYRRFRGADPSPEPLLRNRGFLSEDDGES
ncbi:M3 family metallopeptidase [Ponticaulis profundi]|uniref:M3 family metallopeptidase n=1 Tax=Ponticaulis profundi TaxID=2665222 RepID=A0ABW1SDU2_9PROT